MHRSTSPIGFAVLVSLTLCALAAHDTQPAIAQLGPTGTQFWNQDSPGLTLAMQEAAWFGRAVAAGNFDCDGFDDLALSMPGDDLAGEANVGLVLVLYGTESGLSASGHQLWSQNNPAVTGGGDPDDFFGWALATGDFDGDGCADLAIGSPYEDITTGDGTEVDAGAINVLYGSLSGLTGDGDLYWYQELASIAGVSEADDHFGWALATGDFDDDGYDDLAVGAPDENLEGEETLSDVGVVHVFFGTAGGLTTTGDLLFVPGSGAINYAPSANDHFGAALAAGDLYPGLGAELIVGVPERDSGGDSAAGAIVVILDLGGSPHILLLSQDAAGVPGVAEAGDRFGAALATGDFDGDGLDEVAVGVPGEDIEASSATNGGAINILNFFYADGDQIWTQNDLNPEAAENLDEFGSTLAAGDFDGDGIADLAIGVPGENLSTLADAGLIHVVFGSSGSGLTASGDQLWLQTVDPSDSGDNFGWALAAGRFSGHSGSDLAIAAPFETLGSVSQTGGVNVLYSIALFLDGFESGSTSAWSATAP